MKVGDLVFIPYWEEGAEKPTGYAEAMIVEIEGDHYTCQVSHQAAFGYSKDELVRVAAERRLQEAEEIIEHYAYCHSCFACGVSDPGKLAREYLGKKEEGNVTKD